MARSDRAVRALLERYLQEFPDEAARELEQLPLREVVGLLQSHSAPVAGRALQQLTPDLAAEALAALAADPFRGLMRTLEPVRAASLLARLDADQRERRLALLEPAEAKEIRTLMSYPSGTAGAVMDARITTFRADATVKEALAKLRALRGRPIADVFVIGDDGRLIGAMPLQELAVADTGVRMDSLRLRVPVSVQATSSREEVVEVFQRGIGTTIPVVDYDGRPVGLIRNDVLVAATQQEATADLQKMVGASTDERALSSAPFAVKKRLPWLQINLATAFLASAVVGIFEDTIAKYTALAVLLPVVAGQSGNTGMQALAVTLRGLALREIRLRHWPRVAFKELGAGALNGMAVALVTALGVYLWSDSTGLAVVIGTAMVGSMVIASIAGASVPMLLTALGLDPAQASSVVLTTLTDCGGFFSFLGLATLMTALL
ncbi:MAG: magnesium transporter [Gemmatimonadetes bacterium]|nr:magnesium transporter [Gemmatimonadota bacterium]MBI2404463.1 magnesium transporter [Gemmatimonadota bacterium]MBI2614900.1 magnesium transporter [Gemmatimonadota bacterium]